METLSFNWKHRRRKFLFFTNKTKKRYIDFIVSGKSLRQILWISKLDRIGIFGWGSNKDYEFIQIKEYLKQRKPELSIGRTMFYVCPECGDIGCGAITAEIIEIENKIVWKEFAYENSYSEPDTETYKRIGPFEFDKKEYEQVFENIRIELCI